MVEWELEGDCEALSGDGAVISGDGPAGKREAGEATEYPEVEGTGDPGLLERKKLL